MTPRFERKEALTFIGLGKDYNLSNADMIGALWDEFQTQKQRIGETPDTAAYGICYAPKAKEVFSDKFHYTAALRVNDNTPVPAGMEKICIMAQEYAVFTHKGSLADMTKTNDYIWKTWLPMSGLELADAPDFEVYGEHWDGENGEIDIFVPLAR